MVVHGDDSTVGPRQRLADRRPPDAEGEAGFVEWYLWCCSD
jgi:hypothetical protein